MEIPHRPHGTHDPERQAWNEAYKLSDERSLFLLVMPNGAKYWRFSYRFLGKDKTLALGVWPEVNLAEARDKRDSARKMVADSVAPLSKRSAGSFVRRSTPTPPSKAWPRNDSSRSHGSPPR